MARWLGMIFFAAALALGGASAQEAKKLDIEAVFKKLDANNDGKLNKDEFLKLADNFKDKDKARAKLTKAFEEIDPQNVGLSRDQFRKYFDAISLKKKAKDKTS
jgi:Ca2+-binding EF-hand superfamily protein